MLGLSRKIPVCMGHGVREGGETGRKGGIVQLMKVSEEGEDPH